MLVEHREQHPEAAAVDTRRRSGAAPTTPRPATAPPRAAAACLRARPRSPTRSLRRDGRRGSAPTRRARRRGRPRPSRTARARGSTRSGASARAGGGASARDRRRSVSTVSTTCSSRRGPASVPSFVTWPTMTVGNARSLASCTSRCAPSRTCDTDPGAPGWSGSTTVWIESSASTAGLDRVDVCEHVRQRRLRDHEQLGHERADALGAHPHLRARLLRGDEQAARAAPRQSRRAPGAAACSCPCPARRRAA